jgi:hypothetical protein
MKDVPQSPLDALYGKPREESYPESNGPNLA